MEEKDRQEVYLEPSEALALSALLWNIVSDPSTEHDRKVDAIHHAGHLELKVGIPGAATHTEATNKRVKYFEKILSCLRRDVAIRTSGLAWTDQAPGHCVQNEQVPLAWAPSVVLLLWQVATDTSSRNRDIAAYFACLLEHKIGAQLHYEFDEDDVKLYSGVITSLEAEIQRLSELAEEQKKSRPAGWPPVGET